MKKILHGWGARCICTALVAATLLCTSAQAAPVINPSELGELPPTGTIEPKGEEFIYYYRIYNGVKQYRIWSATYSRWVTDWTNCM